MTKAQSELLKLFIDTLCPQRDHSPLSGHMFYELSPPLTQGKRFCDPET